MPEQEGYHFIGWSQASNNVQNDMIIEAVYEVDTYKVVYVDWENQTVDMQHYTYGECLELPDLPETEEGVTVEWVVGDGSVDNPQTLESFINEGNVVTEDMVISTKYSLETYTVTIVQPDMEKNIANVVTPENYDSIDYVIEGEDESDKELEGIEYVARVDAELENAEHGDILQIETYEEEMEENNDIIFTGWADASTGELLDNVEVTDNMTIYPVYTFAETTQKPYADVETGEYNSEQKITLSSGTSEAVIYYTIDGSDPSTSKTALEYKEPITLTGSTELKYYACSLGRNDSEVVTDLYAINTESTKDVYHVVTFVSNIKYTGSILIKDTKTLTDKMFDDMPGHILESVSYDQNYEKQFYLDSELIEESCTLYLKYVEKEYNVNFIDYYGNIIKEEAVKYMNSAIEPEMEDVEGYKFAGWDQEFDCVTSNMNIRAKYLPEDKYAVVSLNRSSISLLSNKSFKLSYIIEPYELINEDVEWYSADEMVAVVDEEGVVTGKNEGETEITVKVLSSNETATCRVVCKKDVDTQIVISDSSNFEFWNEYIRNVGANITVDKMFENFDNGTLTYCSIEGEVLTGTNYVGTGTNVQLWDEDVLLDSKEIIIVGDVSGDGAINNKDVTAITRYILELEEFSYIQQLAADVNGDGYVNNKDVSMLSRYLVGKENL